MEQPFIDRSKQQLTVFDSSRAGQRIAAERLDEPGNEHPKPGDGAPGDPTAGRHSESILKLIAEDVTGDWSWKPGRDRLLGDKFVTFKGVPMGTAESLRGEGHGYFRV